MWPSRSPFLFSFAAGEKYDEHSPSPDEVDAVSGTPINPQFGHPFANRRCDGYASGDGCCSCYGPAPLAAAPVVPIPPATAAPPPASGTDGKIPSFNASIYGTSRVR